MWSLLVGSALAGSSSADIVATALAENPSAEVAVVCAPVGTLLGVMSKLPVPPALMDAAGGQGRRLLPLLDPAAAAEAGVDRSGALVLVGAAKGSADLRVPFNGTRAQAEALLGVLYDDVTASGELWRITDNGRARLARLEGGSLRIDAVRSEVVAAPGPSFPPVGPLLDGLPVAPGCTVLLRGVDTEKADGAMAAYVPLAGQAPLLIRMNLDQVRGPAALARGGPVGMAGRSPEAPSMVLSMSVSIDSLLDALASDPTLDMAELGELHRLVAFGPGASLAVFGNPKDRKFSAVIPLTAPDGSALPRRKVVRFITRFSEGKVTRTGGATFRGKVEDTAIYGAVGPGRVVLASDADTVQVVLADAGEPWLTPEMRAYNQEWPIALQSRGTESPFQLRAGVRTVQDTWELALEVTGGNPELTGFMTGMLSALAVPAFVEMSQKAALASVLADVDAIRAAELAWLTDHGVALALPPHPRAVEALGKEPVAWPDSSPWAPLGWRPEGDRTRATYWVEATPDGAGFTVWGAVDADADGNPARFKATRDAPAMKETPDTVY